MARFLCWLFSSCIATTMPVGRWVMRTALSVLLTCWPPAPGRAIDVDAQVGLVDLHVHLLRLRQHRDGHGGGVDAALVLGRRHALHAMHAALVFQPREHAAAGDLGDAFAEPAELGVVVSRISKRQRCRSA